MRWRRYRTRRNLSRGRMWGLPWRRCRRLRSRWHLTCGRLLRCRRRQVRCLLYSGRCRAGLRRGWRRSMLHRRRRRVLLRRRWWCRLRTLRSLLCGRRRWGWLRMLRSLLWRRAAGSLLSRLGLLRRFLVLLVLLGTCLRRKECGSTRCFRRNEVHGGCASIRQRRSIQDRAGHQQAMNRFQFGFPFGDRRTNLRSHFIPQGARVPTFQTAFTPSGLKED